ncbi:MAG: hypothetical protein SOT34_05775 [Candidatus Borkfalkiaceae bacterium]|nr:hypothetical protein [Christensenellaceae bacterium]
MEKKSKIFTYLGFAIKAGKLKTGLNTIETVKKGAYLVLVCKTASENTAKEGVRAAERFRCPAMQTVKQTLGELTNVPNLKIAAVTDKNLAEAIVKYQEEELTGLTGGHKG